MQHQAQYAELDELSNYELVNDNQDIRGADIYSAATGEKIGEIEDMLVDRSAELVKAVRLEDGTCCAVENIQITDDKVVYLDQAAGYFASDVNAADYDAATAQTGSIQLVEENVVVGTREVMGGAISVKSRVESEVVSEDVTLRQEHVEVDTIARNEQITAAEADALLQPQTISATAINEEAVVGKTAEIVGEVRLDKDVDMIQETVSATARKTVVDIDEDADFVQSGTTAYAGDRNSDLHDNATRTTSDSIIDKTADAIDDAFDNTARAAKDLID